MEEIEIIGNRVVGRIVETEITEIVTEGLGLLGKKIFVNRKPGPTLCNCPELSKFKIMLYFYSI